MSFKSKIVGVKSFVGSAVLFRELVAQLSSEHFEKVNQTLYEILKGRSSQ